jgi:glycosyltransferase involved in cell wall biosynthesis
MITMANLEQTPKISIVIPVYNVEKFVGKCLSSLVHQTIQEPYEIIAVNDGSLDNSLEILRQFEESYDFVKIIDQKNKGMSMARNAGLAVAQGEYLCLVDSDDYVAPNYLEELYNAVTQNNADIACCYYNFHFIDSGFTFEYPFRCSGIFSKEQAMNKLLRDMQIQSLVWNKIYKRELFAKNNITFTSMAFEDMIFANKIFLNAEKVVVIDKPLYYYVQQSESTLATMNAGKINDFIRGLAMVRISLENAGVYPQFKKSYLARSRKIYWCCWEYVLKMHYREKCMSGCLTNMKKVGRAIKHYAGDEFSPTTLFSELPDVVNTPELKENYSIR